jgi:hypothetical protein
MGGVGKRRKKQAGQRRRVCETKNAFISFWEILKKMKAKGMRQHNNFSFPPL